MLGDKRKENHSFQKVKAVRIKLRASFQLKKVDTVRNKGTYKPVE